MVKTKKRRWWKENKIEIKVYGWFHFAIRQLPLYDTVKSMVWWVRHRTTNVYHKVNTKLPAGWFDNDIRMLYVCFALLEDYVDEIGGLKGLEEKIEDKYECWDEDIKTGWYVRALDNRFDYQEDIDAYKELRRLYIWWTCTYPEYDDRNPYYENFDKMFPSGNTDIFEDMFSDRTEPVLDKDGDVCAYRLIQRVVPEPLKSFRTKTMDDSMKYELDCLEETERNLHSLIKVRKRMWT